MLEECTLRKFEKKSTWHAFQKCVGFINKLRFPRPRPASSIYKHPQTNVGLKALLVHSTECCPKSVVSYRSAWFATWSLKTLGKFVLKVWLHKWNWKSTLEPQMLNIWWTSVYTSLADVVLVFFVFRDVLHPTFFWGVSNTDNHEN